MTKLNIHGCTLDVASMLNPDSLFSRSVQSGSNGDSHIGPMKWLPMFYTVTGCCPTNS